MFHYSKNRLISLERGDSGSFSVKIDTGDPIHPDPYTLQENDRVYFGVIEPNTPFEMSVIKKVYGPGDQVDNFITIELKPSDTEFLMPGVYYYEVKLYKWDIREEVDENENVIVIDNSKVVTLIPKKKFVILE